MSNTTLNATQRNQFGSSAAKRLRNNGTTPATLCGAQQAPLHFLLSSKDLDHLSRDGKLLGHIFSLSFQSKTLDVLVQNVQRHPIDPTIMHVDLIRVQKNKAIQTSVPILLLGEEDCPARKHGAMAVHNSVSVEISCLPKDLPEYIEADVSHLDLDQGMHFSDLKLPKGVSFAKPLEANYNPSIIVFHAPKVTLETEEEENDDTNDLDASLSSLEENAEEPSSNVD